jgi:NitT/TauT family transport system substrate-binding protein
MNVGSRAGFLTTTAALALAARRPAGAQTALPPLRVGATTADGNAQAYYALDEGMFSRAGLTVDVQTFNSGSQTASALIGGSLDVGTTTAIPIANAVIRGVPFGIICSGGIATVKSPLLLLVVRKSGPIHAAKDFAGKTVGVVTVKTMMQLGLDVYLAKYGVSNSNVKVVELSFGEMGAAIDRGIVDAAVMGEPFLSAALRSNDVRVLVDPLAIIGTRLANTVWFTTQDFGKKYPEAMKRFASVMYESARWANRHHGESAKILAKYSKLNLDDITTMIRADFAESTRLNEIQSVLDAAAKYNYISRPIAASELMLR